MPRLTTRDVGRYGLGTWDLADWTFGTPYAIAWFYKHVSEFDVLDKVIWRVENLLRYWEWKLFLNNHRGLSKVVPLLRNVVFTIGWWKATRR